MALQERPTGPDFDTPISKPRIVSVNGLCQIRNRIGSDAANGFFGRSFVFNKSRSRQAPVHWQFADPLSDTFALIHRLARTQSKECDCNSGEAEHHNQYEVSVSFHCESALANSFNILTASSTTRSPVPGSA